MVVDKLEKSSTKTSEFLTHYESNIEDSPQLKIEAVTIDTIYYNDGSVYYGEVLKGFRQGKGRLVYMNGVTYEGIFKNDLFDGKGKFISENEVVYDGIFSKGVKCGQGVQFNKEATFKYEGQWSGNLKNGFGKFYKRIIFPNIIY